MGDMISYKRPDGSEAGGYLANPAAGESAPGVVVIQEWWGLTDQIKGVCDKYADAGYRALAVDLYDGKVTKDLDEAAKLMNATNFVEAAEQYVGGAVSYLKETGSPKVAVTGFCMGGAVTVISAVKVPNADAAACFYGIPPTEVADPKDIKIPFIGHFADHDEFFSSDKTDALEAGLKEGGAKATVHRYDAQHAFCNEQRPEVYNEAAAKQAWERTMDFLKQNIG